MCHIWTCVCKCLLHTTYVCLLHMCMQVSTVHFICVLYVYCSDKLVYDSRMGAIETVGLKCMKFYSDIYSTCVVEVFCWSHYVSCTWLFPVFFRQKSYPFFTLYVWAGNFTRRIYLLNLEYVILGSCWTLRISKANETVINSNLFSNVKSKKKSTALR